MRKTFFILMVLMGICIIGAAQSSDAKVQRNGNTFSVVKSEKTSKEKVEPVATGYNYEVKGKPYPVFQGAKGGLFYINEKGNKTYLPKEVKEAILAEMKKEGTK